MTDKLIMTPGPTQVAQNVRMARSVGTTNPDLDPDFFDFYKETSQKISDLMHTTAPFYIMSGEAILGLEAACASLTSAGDRVLIIDNGIYGAGFADFVAMYGGTPVLYSVDRFKDVDCAALEDYLASDNDFKYATMVHCDTPSGVLNDIHSICPILKKYGILTVVDAVSSMFGTKIHMDKGEIDILCGGSQKALSAPIGLTFVGVSNDAILAMESRTTPIASFYCNLLMFKKYFETGWSPYSLPASDIMGLSAALDNVLADTEIYVRHDTVAAAVRYGLTTAGLELYLNAGYADTVGVFNVPSGLDSKEILSHMVNEHGIMIAGSFGELEDKVLRIGHMGENARVYRVFRTLDALNQTLLHFGFELKADIAHSFAAHMADPSL